MSNVQSSRYLTSKSILGDAFPKSGIISRTPASSLFIAIIAKIENQQVKYPKRVSLSDANLCFIFYNW
jgi:hypothetical protein